MRKGYIISRVDVVDPEADALYAAAATKGDLRLRRTAARPQRTLGGARARVTQVEMAWSGSLKMAKGYWIARVDVSDPEAYQAYVRANGIAFAKFGGRFLVRGGTYRAAEGVA